MSEEILLASQAHTKRWKDLRHPLRLVDDHQTAEQSQRLLWRFELPTIDVALKVKVRGVSTGDHPCERGLAALSRTFDGDGRMHTEQPLDLGTRCDAFVHV